MNSRNFWILPGNRIRASDYNIYRDPAGKFHILPHDINETLRSAAKSFTLDEAVKSLRIKISGCFNSCGQHHIADLGFNGMSINVGNRKPPLAFPTRCHSSSVKLLNRNMLAFRTAANSSRRLCKDLVEVCVGHEVVGLDGTVR